MKDPRFAKTSMEKFAESNGGLNEGTSYKSFASDEVLDKRLNAEAAAKLEQDSADWAQRYKEHEEKLMETASDLSKHKNLQIKPLGNYVLISPFKVNPFQKIERSASGLIIDTGGYVPLAKSNDSGEFEEEEQVIKQGTVIEVGPDVKWLKKDDIIMWVKASEIPVPFYRLGFVTVSESRAIVVINDDLENRF